MIRTRMFGWIPLPVSPFAWFLFAALLAFAAQVFLAVDSRSHSVSDTLYGVFPYWAPTFLLWCWIGARAQPPST